MLDIEVMPRHSNICAKINDYGLDVMPQIFGCPCANLVELDVPDVLADAVRAGAGGYTVAVNAEKLVRYNSDSVLKSVIDNALLPYPDGAGAVLGLKYLHGLRSEKINMPIVALQTANAESWKTMIVGAKPDVHSSAVARIRSEYPNIDLVSSLHGYCEESLIERSVLELNPQLLLLALGSPKQELLAFRLQSAGCQALIIGCGGALDILAGRLSRAPEIYIRNNLEWLYRLVQEPWRWRRQLVLFRFVWMLLKAIVLRRDQ